VADGKLVAARIELFSLIRLRPGGAEEQRRQYNSGRNVAVIAQWPRRPGLRRYGAQRRAVGTRRALAPRGCEVELTWRNPFMLLASWIAIGSALAFLAYIFVGYPLALKVLASLRRRERPEPVLDEWPEISIVVAAYNEAGQIRQLIENLLELDYPPERRQIVVVSDASTDGTDDIVREYADRGVELVRLPERRGKTGAENYARPYLRGQIIVNTDASIRIGRDALRRLVAQFADPTVGVASGRDVSVTRVDGDANLGESGYVGYEMWLRDLETRVDGIVGASGCLYAIRRDLHDYHLPEGLSRDFAAPLVARQHGYRSVTVNDALCFVPRAPSLRREYTRKVRTITRGMETLFYKRALLNPFRYGLFSWMLFSHKVCRWLMPWALVVLVLGIAALSVTEPWARAVALLILLGCALALAGWLWPDGKRIPRPLAIPTYIAVANIAVLRAWFKAVRGELNPIWEPTRRVPVGSH